MNTNHTLNVTANEVDAQYVLTVTVGDGITGTPATGSYNHTDGDLVNFSYSLQTGYENLVVQLDGITVGSNGIIAMNTNHILTATADESFDVNGDWAGLVVYLSIDYTAQLNFSGGYYSGTVTGDVESLPPGATGTYTITNGSIEFDLDFGGGNIMSLTGTIDDDNNMSGDHNCTWGPSGTWNLERQ
jgi:hypothetical protein